MTLDSAALAAIVIMIFPMAYFGLAAPTFLLVKLEVPQIASLLRGLFKAYFLMASITGAIGTVAFAASGRPAFAIGVGLFAVCAILVGPRFLRQMDAQISARDAGDADAVRRLRRLHWAGMAFNAIPLVAIIASIPYAAVA